MGGAANAPHRFTIPPHDLHSGPTFVLYPVIVAGRRPGETQGQKPKEVIVMKSTNFVLAALMAGVMALSGAPSAEAGVKLDDLQILLRWKDDRRAPEPERPGPRKPHWRPGGPGRHDVHAPGHHWAPDRPHHGPGGHDAPPPPRRGRPR